MRVTLVADASYAMRDGNNAAGWAAFIACTRGKRYYGDAMHVLPVNNIVAEAMAIVNGLYKGIDARLIEWGDHVLIQSDCLPAMSILKSLGRDINPKNKNAAYKAQAMRVVDKFQELLILNNLTFETRHVRGHNGINAPRDYVQDQCDRIAKRHMSTLSKQMRKQANEDDLKWSDASRRGTDDSNLSPVLQPEA